MGQKQAKQTTNRLQFERAMTEIIKQRAENDTAELMRRQREQMTVDAARASAELGLVRATQEVIALKDKIFWKSKWPKLKAFAFCTLSVIAVLLASREYFRMKQQKRQIAHEQAQRKQSCQHEQAMQNAQFQQQLLISREANAIEEKKIAQAEAEAQQAHQLKIMDEKMQALKLFMDADAPPDFGSAAAFMNNTSGCRCVLGHPAQVSLEDDVSEMTLLSATDARDEWALIPRPNATCFASDSPFKMASTGMWKTADVLERGDRVMAADGQETEVSCKPKVVRAEKFIELHAGNATLKITSDHRVMSYDETAKANEPVRADRLREGDWVIVNQAPAKLTHVRELSTPGGHAIKVSFSPDVPVGVFYPRDGIASMGQVATRQRRGGMSQRQPRYDTEGEYQD